VIAPKVRQGTGSRSLSSTDRCFFFVESYLCCRTVPIVHLYAAMQQGGFVARFRTGTGGFRRLEQFMGGNKQKGREKGSVTEKIQNCQRKDKKKTVGSKYMQGNRESVVRCKRNARQMGVPGGLSCPLFTPPGGISGGSREFRVKL